jgi:hypothetical protein
MLRELRKLLPVPESPIDTDESVLAQNVEVLNVQFPEDYLSYGRVYGSGTISVRSYSWEIYSPFRTSYPQFVNDFVEAQSVYREAMDNFHVPLGLFPEPGGLLPFGHRDEKYFTWKTDGQPDDWKVVEIWLYEDDGYQEFDMGFTEFLISVLKRTIQIPGFKSDWKKTDISFTPEVYGD